MSKKRPTKKSERKLKTPSRRHLQRVVRARRVVSQTLRADGVWTEYSDGMEILKPYNTDGSADLDPNNEIFAL